MDSVWPKDIGVLFRWPGVLDVFPSPSKEPARSYNALSRVVLFGGCALFYVQREPVFLAGTAMLMWYLFGQQHKYLNGGDKTGDDDEQLLVSGPDPDKNILAKEAKLNAQRMLQNPRDLGSRAAIVSTVDDRIFASRPVHGGGEWKGSQLPEWMDGKVGTMKSTLNPM